MAKVLDPNSIEAVAATGYPKEFAGVVQGRLKRKLTEALGLTQFGVNVTTLVPGSASSQRHWHVTEDEFCWVLDGELTLITDQGEQVLGPGMAMSFPANDGNGHQLVNRTNKPATYLEIGTRAAIDRVDYPDIDMKAVKIDGKHRFTRKDGSEFA